MPQARTMSFTAYSVHVYTHYYYLLLFCCMCPLLWHYTCRWHFEVKLVTGSLHCSINSRYNCAINCQLPAWLKLSQCESDTSIPWCIWLAIYPYRWSNWLDWPKSEETTTSTAHTRASSLARGTPYRSKKTRDRVVKNSTRSASMDATRETSSMQTNSEVSGDIWNCICKAPIK